MTTLRKYLAFALAGGFFVLVTLMLAGVAITMLTRTSNQAIYGNTTASPGHSYVRHQPAPAEDDPYGGRMVAAVDGQQVRLPTLKTDYDVDIRGDLVSVQVTQRFENPGDVPLDATYQFPLHEDAAVHAMTMRVDDEVVRAVIQEKEEAKQTFEAAKEEGKAAVLTEQHRPNLFQQSVANLMPGKPVEVELRYVHAAERRDGRFHVTLPLVVGPRFNPADMSGNELVDGSGDDEELPEHPPVQELEVPQTIDADRVAVSVRIDAGMPLGLVRSDTHKLDVRRLGRTDARVQLAEGRAVDNRHFELNYAVGGEDTRAGLLADYNPHAERGTFSVLIEPPATVPEDLATPREMVFVLDCSGSMSGQPMAASKAFMRRALHNLRPTDTFRIIRFSDGATEYSREPIEATEANVADALDYVEGLNGSGGTMMSSGVRQALTVPPPDDTIRLVTFMTDGYIGNEFEIVELLRTEIGDARLFAIGVGTGVNRYLIEEMARSGRGFARYVDPTEDVDVVSAELSQRLQTPVLTDITLDAGDSGAANLSPVAIPDLFAGESVRVVGTYDTPGTHRMTIHGRVAGEPVEIPLTVELPDESTDGDAVRLMWARARIADRMHQLTTPVALRTEDATDAQLQEEITRIGLNYSLMTQWTSFVAVSESVMNPTPDENADAAVPVSKAKGVSPTAYSSPSTTSEFGGGSTPEPGIIGGLLMTLLAAGGALRRRREE